MLFLDEALFTALKNIGKAIEDLRIIQRQSILALFVLKAKLFDANDLQQLLKIHRFILLQ